MWFICLFLFGTSVAWPMLTTTRGSTTTAFLDYDSALGYSCHSDTNCGGLVGNSRCLNGVCACQPGYIPQGLMRCIYDKGDQDKH